MIDEEFDDERDAYRPREPLRKNPQHFNPPRPVREPIDTEPRNFFTDWAKEQVARARKALRDAS